MEAKAIEQKERQYFIDWLRILLILSVFLFHIGMVFNSWEWHVKNNVTCDYKSILWYIMVFLGRWRMPLLFLISGAGTFYALGKRSTGQYLGERFKRLIIPLLAGIFILVPVQVYIEKSTNYSSLLDYYPHMFEGIYPAGNFSWHHLWFIAYLFVISLIISPLLRFFKSRAYLKLIKYLEQVCSKPMALNIFIIPLLLSQILLRPFFPEDTHGLIDDWAAVAYFVIFFLAGFIMLSNRSITDSIRRQRRLFLVESVALTVMMFTLPYMVNSEKLGNHLWDVLSICVAWSCGLTAIGYAKQYFNNNHRIRKPANEAIYPFYLLHQPIIVVVANFITKWDIAIGWKAFLITVISFCLVIVIYRFLIYPFGIMRIMFGMKLVAVNQKSNFRLYLQPSELRIRS